jgi:hypothetical protein
MTIEHRTIVEWATKTLAELDALIEERTVELMDRHGRSELEEIAKNDGSLKRALELRSELKRRLGCLGIDGSQLSTREE